MCSKKQPIGLSGMTGYTNIAHLHLNILIPKAGATLISTSIEFEGGIQGHQLKEGAILNNK
ncbi:hypothetical protein [Gynurincola endophyticus]|uniref:hypothetical protein n=1 Tax=Gynurincola endophyticus TaxID=2479004 RepID=UPI000F8DEABC|nr:hypothetical protein [Gynurincola endophyticus]